MKLRIRRWVMWWFSIGIILGVIAISIILGDHLTPPQEKVVLLIGVAHWLLGGIVCWAFESVKVQTRDTPTVERTPAGNTPERYWHPASDFLPPGGRH